MKTPSPEKMASAGSISETCSILADPEFSVNEKIGIMQKIASNDLTETLGVQCTDSDFETLVDTMIY